MNFTKKFDVIVVGGGIAGIAAALAASRQGKKVALLEKTIFTGGLATSGLVNIYLPLCDGNGNQVTFGIAEELLKLSIKYGPGEIPQYWQNERKFPSKIRYQCSFSPASFILSLDELLESSGGDIWLDTLVCDVHFGENGNVNGVWVENKAGRGLLKASVIIDATGDADIIRRAGGDLEYGENSLSLWALQYEKGCRQHKLVNNINMGRFDHPLSKESQIRFDKVKNIKEISESILNSRRLVRKYYDKQYIENNANRNSLFPLTLPSMAQFRKTARIVGRKTIVEEQDGTFQEGSIGLVADWRNSGKVWEIPFDALIPKKIKGVIVAGRCISSSGDAWEVTRVIPAAALTGEAAGAAAALSVEDDILPHQLESGRLQCYLSNLGFSFHLEDLNLAYRR